MPDPLPDPHTEEQETGDVDPASEEEVEPPATQAPSQVGQSPTKKKSKLAKKIVEAVMAKTNTANYLEPKQVFFTTLFTRFLLSPSWYVLRWLYIHCIGSLVQEVTQRSFSASNSVLKNAPTKSCSHFMPFFVPSWRGFKSGRAFLRTLLALEFRCSTHLRRKSVPSEMKSYSLHVSQLKFQLNAFHWDKDCKMG